MLAVKFSGNIATVALQGWVIWILTVHNVMWSGTKISDPAGSGTCQAKSVRCSAGSVLFNWSIFLLISGNIQLYQAISNTIRQYPTITGDIQQYQAVSNTARWSYCPGVLGIASMDTQLVGFSPMGILQPRCSTLSTACRGWFIAGNTNFGGEHFLKKNLKKMWVKRIYIFFCTF